MAETKITKKENEVKTVEEVKGAQEEITPEQNQIQELTNENLKLKQQIGELSNKLYFTELEKDKFKMFFDGVNEGKRAQLQADNEFLAQQQNKPIK